MIGGFTCCSRSTDIGVGFIAGVATLELDTRLVTSAVIVTSALGVASRVGVSQEVRRTGALSSVVDSLTVGVLSTRSSAAGILTPVVLSVTPLTGGTLIVSLTLVTTPSQRIANVGRLASADGSVIRSNLAKNHCLIAYERTHL